MSRCRRAGACSNVGSMSRLVLTVAIASCGTPAPQPRQPAAPAAPSLERIARIATACAKAPEATPVYVTATMKGGRWTSRARVGDRDFTIEPIASTCDGLAIPSSPDERDRSLDAVVDTARRCHQEPPDEVSVAFVMGPDAQLDPSRISVVFLASGPARTFPAPTYVVDLASNTCGPPDGPQM